MKIQRVAIALTVINCALLLFTLAQNRQAGAQQIAPVLRGRGPEIVDSRGRLRAQIIVVPATTTKDGTEYAETALLRLIDPNGRPAVKLSTSVDGSGMTLGGDSRSSVWSGVQILAGSAGSSLKMTNRDGREQLIKP